MYIPIKWSFNKWLKTNFSFSLEMERPVEGVWYYNMDLGIVFPYILPRRIHSMSFYPVEAYKG